MTVLPTTDPEPIASSSPGDGGPGAACSPPAAPDERAQLLKQLFLEHNQALVSFLTVRLRSEQEARDVAQEAYLRLLQLDNPTTGNFLRAYLFRIASNLAIDRLRHRSMQARVYPRGVVEEAAPAPPDLQAAAIEELAAVRKALQELPAKASHAFVLYMFSGRTIESIAQEMSLSGRMVRYHIARALEHCRARLAREDET
ncbi:MAG: RNA polymerase sigma factor [Steroidobacteraceae bacterium]